MDNLSNILNALSQATLTVVEIDNLPFVLQRIVDTARELASAQYAALAIPPDSQLPDTFLYSGMDAETAARIPHQPEGLGLLGDMGVEKKPIRIARLADDPRFTGFPSNHPPMDSFLGVPILMNDVAFGRLYLTNKVGADTFSDLDEKLIQTLAAHAAIAIKNARLMQAGRVQQWHLARRNKELAALTKAVMAIAGEIALEKVLQQIVDSARELIDAQYAALGVPNSDGFLETFVTSGIEPEAMAKIPQMPRGLGLLGSPNKEKNTIRVPDVSRDPRSIGFPEGHPEMIPFLGVSVVAGDEVLGNLYLTNKSDADAFSEDDQELVETLASHAAVAIQNARLYEQVSRLAIVEERTRIGMDLHDGIIQSIYAVGLTLESARLVLPDVSDEADTLLAHAIEGLNDTIRDIRNYILDLRPLRFQGNLEQGLGRLLREFQANTMTPVVFSTQVPDFINIPTPVAQALFLTTQEALANIARHAKATEVSIEIERDDETIIVTINDDGQGFDLNANDYSVGHGLSNMRARAEDLQGIFELYSAPGEGTRIRLCLPI